MTPRHRAPARVLCALALALPLAPGCGAAPPVARALDHVSSPPAAPPAPSVARTAPPSLAGYWEQPELDAFFARVRTVHVRADTSRVTPAERRAIAHLFRAGELVDRLYESMRHPEALRTRDALDGYRASSPAEQQRLDALRRLERFALGPIVRLPDGRRVPWAPVAPYEPGRNFYPSGTTAESLAAYTRAHPADAASLDDERSLVRHRTQDQLAGALAALDRFPVLDALHPGLRARLAAPAEPGGFVAIPYSVADPAETVAMHDELVAASADLAADDPDLAQMLALRARDLLADDYRAGDAYWVTAAFEHLDVELGAYETYDDHLLGRRPSYALSILLRVDDDASALTRVLASLPRYESELPGGPYNTAVRATIPVGVYDVIADFGQSRGTNTASTLPNDPEPIRRFGRRILMRRNILRDPALVEEARQAFRAAVVAAHQADLTADGPYHRTLFHEVGHYLGPKVTASGTPVTVALGDVHNTIEEMKADLVSLFLVPRLLEAHFIDAAGARSFYAAGVLRTLLRHAPTPSQPYETMSLVQQNYWLEAGALRFDPAQGRLEIHEPRLRAAVVSLLREVLAIQRDGDVARARALIERYARWRPEVQGVMAERLRAVTPDYHEAVYDAQEAR